MLTYFGTPTACRRRSRRRSGDHNISSPFWILFGMWEYVTGMGHWPMGLPMFRPILYINRCLGKIEVVVHLCDVNAC
jgi:hypothetical protein